MGTFKEGINEFKADTEDFTGNTDGALDAITPGPNFRSAEGVNNRNRQVMTWRLPNGAGIQMYINPENFQVNESKTINHTRTKGGFVVQYWGDNLTEITLRGTTGSSGVRGVQVLRDIYRAENKAFELVAVRQTQQLRDSIQSNFNIDTAGDALRNASEAISNSNFILRPSLGSLALSILLFYQGIQYRGFFTSFSVTESTEKLGLFDYNLVFMVTETRGRRKNFMAWHKEPLADDLAGQLINGIGNAIRSTIGLGQQAPQQFHPGSAPLTFGGNSVASLAGVQTTGAQGSSLLGEGSGNLLT